MNNYMKILEVIVFVIRIILEGIPEKEAIKQGATMSGISEDVIKKLLKKNK